MKTELIPQGVLRGARQRLGAEDGLDTSQDHHIIKASPMQIISWYSGWKLGDDEWGRSFVQSYLDMVDAEKRDG